MSKVSEAYLDLMREDEPRKGKKRQLKKKPQPQIEGQYSFVTAAGSNELEIDSNVEVAQREKRKQAILDYYEAFLTMLERYGTFNRLYGPWCSFESGHPSVEAVSLVNFHYGGEVGGLEEAMKNSRHWLKVAREKLAEAAQKIDLFEVSAQYNEAYRSPDRREKVRSYIRTEMKKVENGKTLEAYSPQDMETRYQMNRAKRAPH